MLQLKPTEIKMKEIPMKTNNTLSNKTFNLILLIIMVKDRLFKAMQWRITEIKLK